MVALVVSLASRPALLPGKIKSTQEDIETCHQLNCTSMFSETINLSSELFNSWISFVSISGQTTNHRSQRFCISICFSLCENMNIQNGIRRGSNERVFLFPPIILNSCSCEKSDSFFSQRRETTTHAYLLTIWSSGMRYGGGGVAKGGHDCRYRMHEIGVYQPKRESMHFARIFEVDDLSNRLSTRQTVQRGATHGVKLRPKTIAHPSNKALDALIGGPPNYGDGGVVREVRL